VHEPTYCENTRKPEYIINCLLNISLQFGPGHWSLGASWPLGHDNFERQYGMLACEPSKAPTTLSRLLEVLLVLQYPRQLQVGLLFTWALEKKAGRAFNLLNLNGYSLQRITAYLFSTVLRRSSNLQKILSQTAFYAYPDDISLQRVARANLRDPKPTNSAARPVPVLEAVEASGRLARALQW
jgi:hypothetical protein